MRDKFKELAQMFEDISMSLVAEGDATPRTPFKVLLGMMTDKLGGQDPDESMDTFDNSTDEDKRILFETSLVLLTIACTQVDGLLERFVEDGINRHPKKVADDLKNLLDSTGLSLN